MAPGYGSGRWLFNGIDPSSLLGARAEIRTCPDWASATTRTSACWPYPNPTVSKESWRAFCPPHYPDMRAAVEAIAKRKFGPGDLFIQTRPARGRTREGSGSAAQVHDEEFRRCVAHQAQYIYDTFGKFPGHHSVQSSTTTYLQAHHLDTSFTIDSTSPGLSADACRHMERWHSSSR